MADSLALGASTVDALAFGPDSADAAYLGTKQVFSAVSGPTGPNGTPVIDNFNRANQAAPLLSSPWIDPSTDGNDNTVVGLGITSNTALPPGATVGIDGQSFDASFPTTHCETWFTIAAISTANGSPQLYFDCPGGYELELSPAAAPQQWNVYDLSVSLTYIPVSGPAVSVGDGVGLSFDGTHLKAWHKPAAGAWTVVLDYTTTGDGIEPPDAGAPNGGVFISATTAIDEVGGGSF